MSTIQTHTYWNELAEELLDHYTFDTIFSQIFAEYRKARIVDMCEWQDDAYTRFTVLLLQPHVIVRPIAKEFATLEERAAHCVVQFMKAKTVDDAAWEMIPPHLHALCMQQRCMTCGGATRLDEEYVIDDQVVCKMAFDSNSASTQPVRCVYFIDLTEPFRYDTPTCVEQDEEKRNQAITEQVLLSVEHVMLDFVQSHTQKWPWARNGLIEKIQTRCKEITDKKKCM